MSTNTGRFGAAPLATFTGTRAGSLQMQRRAEARAAYLFILPTIFGFVLFVAGPIIASILLSFIKYDVVNPPRAIGLDNYRQAFADGRVATSLRTTVVFVILANALELVLALLLTIGIQRKVPGWLRYFYRLFSAGIQNINKEGKGPGIKWFIRLVRVTLASADSHVHWATNAGSFRSKLDG